MHELDGLVAEKDYDLLSDNCAEAIIHAGSLLGVDIPARPDRGQELINFVAYNLVESDDDDAFSSDSMMYKVARALANKGENVAEVARMELARRLVVQYVGDNIFN